MYLFWLALCVFAADWPQFRGPNGSGVSDSTGLPIRFGRSTNLAWSTEAPFGRSSPVVDRGRVYLTGSESDAMVVLAYDAVKGRLLWRYRTNPLRSGEMDVRNDIASPTPASDGENIFVFFQDLGLLALDTHGNELWRLPLGPFRNNYGIGSSPVVFGENVFVVCEQYKYSFLVAVNKRTGKLRWRAERPTMDVSYVTPVIYSDRGEVVLLGSASLDAYDAETGRVRWSLPLSGGLQIPLPVLNGNVLIATVRGSDEPTFPTWAALTEEIDLNRDGRISFEEAKLKYQPGSFGVADFDHDGYWTEAEWNQFRMRGVGEYGFTAIDLSADLVSKDSIKWRYKRGIPYVPSPVIYQGSLYSVRSGGLILSIDAKTGELRKEGRSPQALGEYFASPVAADDKVFLASAEGKITVLKAGNTWEILEVNDIGDMIFATPAIAGKALYVRTKSMLYCFQEDAKKRSK